MDGLLDVAWKVFLFIMLVTSWRELVKIGVKMIAWTAGFLTGLLDCIGKNIRWFNSK